MKTLNLFTVTRKYIILAKRKIALVFFSEMQPFRITSLLYSHPVAWRAHGNTTFIS